VFEFLLGHPRSAYEAGDLAFARGWPLWIGLLLAVAGLAAIAVSLLRRRELSVPRRAGLGLLQFAFLALLLVLLWRPVLNVERIRDRENVVAVAIDDSRSMNEPDADGAPTRREAAVGALGGGVLDAIERSSQLRLFGFSDRAEAIDDTGQLAGGAPQTRIGGALDTVLQMAGSVPLAAVVLVSDGGETGGSLDEAALRRLADLGIPVHTVGVGPEAPDNDLELVRLVVPPEAIAGESLRAEVSVRHQQQRTTRLRVYDGGRLLSSEEIPLRGTDGITTASVEFPAGDAGFRDLRFTLDPAPQERNLANNTRRTVMDVSGRRRAVLYVEGEPRWEYKFIRRAVGADRSLRLASIVRATPNRYYRQGVESAAELPDGFPADAKTLFGYDAVVIGSFEAAALDAAQHAALRDFVDRRGGGLLMLAGRDGLADGGWGRVPVAQVLPADIGGRAERSYGARSSRARLTVYGAESAVGRLAGEPKANAAAWEGLPPLADFQPLGTLRPGARVLIESVAGDSVTPLLATQRFGRGSAWLLGTATTWRWKMRLPHEDERQPLFWRQLLHALAAGSPPRVRLDAGARVFDDTSQVPLEAEVLDAEYRPVPDAVVSVRAVSETGRETQVALQPSGRGDGRYNAVFDAQEPGLYRLELDAKAGATDLGTASTHLVRQDGVLERFGTWQQRAMLERIAAATGGRYWRLEDLGDLPDVIRYSKAGMIERQTLDLWNIPAVFLVLLALKAAEWLLRRRWRRL
jgi:hypothetical protein